MMPIDYLIAAKSAAERKDKVELLFVYFKKRKITQTKQAMIELVGYTDKQIDDEIDQYQNFEIDRQKGLDEAINAL